MSHPLIPDLEHEPVRVYADPVDDHTVRFTEPGHPRAWIEIDNQNAFKLEGME